MEYAVKRIFFGKTVSAVPPKPYSQRFKHFAYYNCLILIIKILFRLINPELNSKKFYSFLNIVYNKVYV